MMMMIFELLMQTGVIIHTYMYTHTYMYYNVVWIHVPTNTFYNVREAVTVAV